MKAQYTIPQISAAVIANHFLKKGVVTSGPDVIQRNESGGVVKNQMTELERCKYRVEEDDLSAYSAMACLTYHMVQNGYSKESIVSELSISEGEYEDVERYLFRATKDPSNHLNVKLKLVDNYLKIMFKQKSNNK